LDGGHYITFVRASRIGYQPQVSGAASAWFYASDEHVRDASLEEVLGSQAYILFYERLKQPNVNTSLETHSSSITHQQNSKQ
jgi:ubiquitin carboxyl-terminal hydrolase 16/45